MAMLKSASMNQHESSYCALSTLNSEFNPWVIKKKMHMFFQQYNLIDIF